MKFNFTNKFFLQAKLPFNDSLILNSENHSKIIWRIVNQNVVLKPNENEAKIVHLKINNELLTNSNLIVIILMNILKT